MGWFGNKPLTDGKKETLRGAVRALADGEVEAPFTGRRCVAWSTTVKVPKGIDWDGRALDAKVLRGGPGALSSLTGGVDRYAMREQTRADGVTFALDTKRGSVTIDARRLTLVGIWLLVSPRDTAREERLFESWQVGAFPREPGYPEPSVEEVIVVAGETVEVTDVVRIVDGAAHVAQPHIHVPRAPRH